ncbi:MAG: response regulator [Spartobacteria bacterium]|nr:response regulator [Spartobacteria bacterium]
MGKILIVDDEANTVYMLGALLRREGYAVETFNEGAAAMEALENGEDIDLLVTDLRMSPIDGMELIQAARVARPDMRIIVVSGVLTEDTRANLNRMGCSIQIAKPFRSDELLDAVKNALK